ncbi:gephyrin-like molybdotransferase Glp [Extensimonas vulgaris]|uniref:Molybdopterin molybdenumtransferase n=1 Tax=Extensimonas vulgaris TaxID=1031594 RepID=A0A369AHF0_9BURK|nr:molybdopterin molybdotransferase [Extensimonas vulgaris]TWI34883.1 molybdopterin molybdotransferase [Extensimonas vulgaris]
MTMKHPPLKPFDEALAELLARATPLPGRDTVATWDADGRVLAADAVSPLHVPPQDNSAMDGYALRCADVPAAGTVLRVAQRIAAGSSGQPLQPGTAARIFTGAPVPPGADAVVMQENCEALSGADAGASASVGASDTPDAPALGRVRIHTVPQPGQAIRRAGEDITRGAVVLRAGTRLTPAALGLAASIGMDKLQVVQRPRVALFSTGDELVMPGELPPERMPPGAIYNSNRFFLRALLQRLGCHVTDLGIVPDQREATVAALRTASAQHDLILTSGGVSVGEEDHVKPAVQALGRLDLWQIAIKPGKPFAYGHIDAATQGGTAGGTAGGVAGKSGPTHFIGLPGNPVSSLITFMLLVRPFVLRLQGVADVLPRFIGAAAHFDWRKADQRREFLRVRRNAQGGLELFANQGSGVLTSTVWADGIVDVPPGQPIARGDTVRYLPFAELMA